MTYCNKYTHTFRNYFLLFICGCATVNGFGYSINSKCDRINTMRGAMKGAMKGAMRGAMRGVGVRKYSTLNMDYNGDYKLPSEIIKQLSRKSPSPGATWTYQTFIDNLNKNNVESVSIFSDQKGFAVIDKNFDIQIPVKI